MGELTDIMKTQYDFAFDKCIVLNKFSRNKKFIPYQSNEDWYSKCENYIDHVDLTFEKKRAVIHLNFDDYRLSRLFSELSTKNNENEYKVVDCFRMYWTYHKSSIYLYPWDNHSIWSNLNNEIYYPKLFEGLNEVFKLIKPAIEKTKK